METEYNKCDVCGVENEKVRAGRWIFYCPDHKQVDLDKIYENETAPMLADGDFSKCDGELSEIMEVIC